MKRPINPITIAFARKNAVCIEVHFLRCANVAEFGFDRFGDDELVMDLPRRRRFRCSRCGGTKVETRPQYPFRSDRRFYLGLAKRSD